MPLSINVLPIEGKKILVPLHPNAPVNQLIAEIIKRCKLDANEYTLYFKGELFGTDTLESLGIQDGAELTLCSPTHPYIAPGAAGGGGGQALEQILKDGIEEMKKMINQKKKSLPGSKN
ncbi:hypothetical protein SAMD00019534_084350 [Acytostelium subglobosum LB1]|uniref:hypothetical protein n=1 Tax=Acytostelium subglobosum LB1 TaxID=1410327 RepID=UPI000644F2BD|nr:hypothetical protein SAMD00019534_084350 [Acytostelium subglobosum LB1]GAM25260.1 hypothetical protein SAMD00019534_084350 [Acytostelium subglobosum LB1]|eukprot:XP_012751780.1 hypothetical protein SAMD00019534_084350 [Acytostelium subglobosum LB1]